MNNFIVKFFDLTGFQYAKLVLLRIWNLCIKIVSSSLSNFPHYSAPPGDEFAPNFFIEDVYDGDEQVDEKHGPKLINGLGVLSDGFYGSNVTLLESGLSSGE